MLIAERYGWDKKFEKAFEYYDYIAKYYPASDAGKLAGLEISKAKVKMFMSAADEPNAIIAIDELIKSYASDEALKEITSKTADYASFDQSLMEITKQLGWEKRYDSALKYYDYMSANFADEALVADASLEADRLRVIRIEDTQDEPNSLIAIDEFIAKHAEHARVAEVAYEFAQYYDWKNSYEPNDFTKTLLNKVIEKFPESAKAKTAKLHILKIDALEYIADGDFLNAMAQVDVIVRDYNDLNDAAENLLRIGKGFSTKGWDLRSSGDEAGAMKSWEYAVTARKKIIEHMPHSPSLRNAYGATAVVLADRMGKYEEGIEYFRIILDKWPGDEQASLIQYFIGKYLDKFKVANNIVAPEMDAQIEREYELVIENYPDSKEASAVAMLLFKKNYNKQDWANAINYMELYLGNYADKGETENYANCLLKLGSCYENIQNYNQAMNLYAEIGEFLSDPNAPLLQNAISRIEALEEILK